MPKGEKPLIEGWKIVEQLRLPELRNGLEQFVIGQGRDRFQNRHGDQPSDDGRGFENLLGDILKMVDTRGNDGLDGCR